MSDRASTAKIISWPQLQGGVLTGTPDLHEDLQAYRDAGGYHLLDQQRPPAELRDHLAVDVVVSQLRGRGGAGFPFSTKMDVVHREAVQARLIPVVVANGAEGEPLCVKDRYLMRHRPHLVLDGAALAARALGAEVVHLYACDTASLQALAVAVQEAVAAGVVLPRCEFHEAQDTFVAGEATAAVRSINSRVARPVDHPPRMSRHGVDGLPTLVSNVETLARLARAVMPEPPSGESPLLVTFSAPGVSSALVEVPYGLPVTELLAALGQGSGAGASVLVGGFFGGLIPVTDDLDLSLTSLSDHGGALGCASIHLVDRGANPVAVASAVADYYAGNNARQCRSCVESTKDIALALQGAGGNADVTLPRLARWSEQIVGRGACAVPDGVALLLRSLLRHFPAELEAFLSAPPSKRPDWASLTVAVPTPRPNEMASVGGVA